MRSYKLNLLPQTIRFLKKMKRKYNVLLSVGDIKEFDIDDFNLPPAAGYFIASLGFKFIYINDRQPFKTGHDYIVLHEIGHLLAHRYKRDKFAEQEEAYANGFAISMATELNIDINKKIIERMSEYSKAYFDFHNKQKKKKRKL